MIGLGFIVSPVLSCISDGIESSELYMYEYVSYVYKCGRQNTDFRKSRVTQSISLLVNQVSLQ